MRGYVEVSITSYKFRRWKAATGRRVWVEGEVSDFRTRSHQNKGGTSILHVHDLTKAESSPSNVLANPADGVPNLSPLPLSDMTYLTSSFEHE